MRSIMKKYIIDIDKFHQIKKLGEGAFAAVYLVENKDTNRQYALKQIDLIKILDSNESRLQDILNREISIMAKLNHPAIIKFYGFNIIKEDEIVSILMQYAPKGTLSSIIYNKKGIPGYNSTARQKILIGISRCMQYVHKNRLMHRDLKPENILIGANFNPYVSDFGFARYVSNERTVTEGIGTPLYLAPEILKGRTDYNCKVDVYSFGLIMYQIVTGIIPFEAYFKKQKEETNSKKVNPYLFYQHVINDGRPNFPEKLIINPKIKELIEMCWVREPAERPTFEEIFEKLAFGASGQIYENVFDNDLAAQYFIDEDVDSDEVSSYVDDLFTRENTADISIMQTLDEIKLQVESIKQDSELQINEIKAEMSSFKEKVKGQISALQKDQKKSPRTVKQFHTKEFDYTSGSSFEGIFHHLTEKAGSNIDDCKMIKITTNSMHQDDNHYFFKEKDFYHPRNIVDFDKQNEYKSKDAGGAIVCFDFKEKLVQVRSYQIQSTSNQKGDPHLKNWTIEVSADGLDWEEIDTRKNDENLRGPGRSYVFTVRNQRDGFYRYVRLRQTGPSWYNCYNSNIIDIAKMEFYGSMKEPSTL